MEVGDEIKTPESLQMDFATVKAATGHFSDANMLGRGGFGTVYKVVHGSFSFFLFFGGWLYGVFFNLDLRESYSAK